MYSPGTASRRFSVTALSVAAMRQGQTVSIGKWDNVGPNDSVFIINAARTLPFGRVLEAVTNGSTVVVSGAGDNPFLRGVRSAVWWTRGQTCLLGHCRGRTLNTYAAWDVTSDRADHEPITARDHVVGVIERLGKGN